MDRSRRQKLWLGKGDNNRVQREDPVLLIVPVEIVPFYAFRGFFKGDNRFRRRHLPEGIGPFIETVAGHHDLAVSDGGAPRAVDRQAIRRFPKHPDHQIDAIDLKRRA